MFLSIDPSSLSDEEVKKVLGMLLGAMSISLQRESGYGCSEVRIVKTSNNGFSFFPEIKEMTTAEKELRSLKNVVYAVRQLYNEGKLQPCEPLNAAMAGVQWVE